jgi:zinc protease
MLQVRLFERLRDAEGATYSPQAATAASESFPGWGVLYAAAELRPERTDLFYRMARQTVADLAAHPAGTDEFARAINPVLSGLDRLLKTNGYWVAQMENWSKRPELIEQTRSLLPDYRSMTAEQVRAAVAAWVADQGDWSMLVSPATRASGVQ